MVSGRVTSYSNALMLLQLLTLWLLMTDFIVQLRVKCVAQRQICIQSRMQQNVWYLSLSLLT